MKKQTKPEEQAFESAFAQLEEIVGKLEGGDLPLDQAMALFEQGQKLAALCSARLDEAELKVQQLASTGAVEPFDVEGTR